VSNSPGKLFDSYGRQIRDLRVSLTDRCNFRCFYCLPDGEPPLARKETILTFEEIERVCGIFVSLGIEKIRLTGGEPMLRRNIETLIEKIARLKVPRPETNPKSEIRNPKLKDLALTTNGFSIPDKIESLKAAGLDRITLSLDSLQKEKFREITGRDELENVLAAIAAVKRAGLEPVKLNAVIVRGVNDDELVDFARLARERDVSIRFIEFMPLDSGHDWTRDMVVSGNEIRERIGEVFPLVLKQTSRGSGTAWNYRFADTDRGEIGIIAPVTQMFCGACSRIRLTADGQLRTCLFSNVEHNLRDVLRSGANRAEIVRFIEAAVMKKEAGHRINDEDFRQPARTMSFIGG
jgi:GTP 3',8-cyclase